MQRHRGGLRVERRTRSRPDGPNGAPSSTPVTSRGSARRATWPMPRCSWPATRPIGSPASPCRSTAAARSLAPRASAECEVFRARPHLGERDLQLALVDRRRPRLLRKPHRSTTSVSRSASSKRPVTRSRPRPRSSMPGSGSRTCSFRGPSPSTRPTRGASSENAWGWCIDTALALRPELVVFTTGPAGRLPWERAADALEEVHAPRPIVEAAREDLPLAIEHTHSLRTDVGFVHTLRDAIELAWRLDVGRLPRGQRVLGRTQPGRHHQRRDRRDLAGPAERLRDRHPHAPRTGSYPATATSRSVGSSASCSTPATRGCSTSRSSARRSRTRATSRPSTGRSNACSY